MAYRRIALVTGANKGIGLAIVRQLALQYPKSPLNDGPLLIYLAARDKERGEKAVESVQDDAQLKAQKVLASEGGLASVRFRQLDITKSESIRECASFLESNHPDGIDIVINNAAMAMQDFNSEVVKETFGCNYYGTLEAIRAFLPLIRDDGRLVNVSSVAGSLSKYSTEVATRFRETRSVSDVTKIMEDFTAAVSAGKEKEQGYPSAAYAVSKAGVTGMTRAIAEEQKAKGSKVLVNSCCPGWVKTDMTRGGGIKTSEQGAQTPTMLAVGDIGGKTGLFWSDEKPIDW